jgi:hypothetical protein
MLPDTRSRLADLAGAWKRGGMALVLMEGTVPDLTPSPYAFGDFSWIPQCLVETVGWGTDQHLRLSAPDDKFAALAALFRSQAEGLSSARSLKGGFPFPGVDEALLINDAGETKSMATRLGSGAVGLLLPSFPRKINAVRRLLTEVLPVLGSSTLFPARDDPNWAEKDQYQLSEVDRIRTARRRTTREHEQRLGELEEEEAAARGRQAPFVSLLELGHEELRQAVIEVFRWLEFEDVVDADAERQKMGQNRREDIWLRDPGYEGIIEVTHGRGGARERDLADLTKYWRLRIREIEAEGGRASDLRGLLVASQHTGQEPALRQPLYDDNPAMLELAEVQGFGLLSTWDLFRLVQRVDAEEISKADARRIITTGIGIISGDAVPPERSDS